MRMERFVLDFAVAGEHRLLERLLCRVLDLVIRCAQQNQLLIDRRCVSVVAKCQKLPEPFRRRNRRVVAGRFEDVVEPALRLCEALVLTQVYGDSKWNVKEQLPVVIRVWPTGVDVDLFRMMFDLERGAPGQYAVELIEKRWIRQPLLVDGIEKSRKRLALHC